MRLLVRWLVSAAALMIVARFVPGFYIRSFGWAMIAALLIGFVNATLGSLMRVLTFPLTVLTLGLFLIVINAAMLKVAAFFLSPEFEVRTWTAAFIGSIVLSLLSAFLHWLVGDKREQRS